MVEEMSFAANLKKAMEERNMSQAELSACDWNWKVINQSISIRKE